MLSCRRSGWGGGGGRGATARAADNCRLLHAVTSRYVWHLHNAPPAVTASDATDGRGDSRRPGNREMKPARRVLEYSSTRVLSPSTWATPFLRVHITNYCVHFVPCNLNTRICMTFLLLLCIWVLWGGFYYFLWCWRNSIHGTRVLRYSSTRVLYFSSTVDTTVPSSLTLKADTVHVFYVLSQQCVMTLCDDIYHDIV